ncbi:MAG: GNAT family N-acetyltransferase [Elainellaceae cyanobacterium]
MIMHSQPKTEFKSPYFCPPQSNLIPQQQLANITIRHAEPDDCASLHQLFTEPQVIYWTIEIPFSPIEKTQKRLSDHPDTQYTLVACEHDQVVGTLGITMYNTPRMRHVARLGPIAVHPNTQGKGIDSQLMTAALDLTDRWLNIHRLELFVYADNAAAIALYKKFGFMVEGVLREFAFRNGEYVDGYLMGRLRESSK